MDRQDGRTHFYVCCIDLDYIHLMAASAMAAQRHCNNQAEAERNGEGADKGVGGKLCREGSSEPAG